MKKKYLLVLFSLFISSCSINIGNSELGISEATQSNFNTVTSFLTNNNSTVEIDDKYQENTGDFKIISNINNSYTVENKIYTIINEGDFTISGTLENGQIKVLAPSKKVNIYLSGVTMTSTEDALIYVEDADKVNIKAVEGTYNELNDNRPLQDSSVDDETGNAAIYTKADTDLEGKGTLVVNATYNNGIHTKNDLNIKNLSLKVNAVNNAIKANDSLTIESGNIIAISKSGNGLKTSNSNISSKGNQRGTITITGGNIDIYSALDAIDAAYNVFIDDIKSPMLNIHTDKYSSYTGDVADISSSFIYLRIKSSLYSSSYRYAASFYNSIDDYVWKDAVYYELEQSNRNIYYVYKVNVPSGYTNVQFYKFDKDQNENSFDNYISKSEGGVINKNNDTYSITKEKNGVISGSWSIYGSSSQGGMNSGNTNKSDYSSKGIKAYNELLINGGTVSIEANDDGIHARSGDTLENGETGLGNIIINNGYIQVKSSDDGIHADNILRVVGGQINILESYEGLEGNQIYITGGQHKVFSSDDGLNATDGNLNGLIQVEGGFIEVEVGSGDTDAIDSNGTYTQKGGVVIAKGGSSSGMASALDIDSTMTITGGTFIAAGSICTTPSSNSTVNYILFGSVSSMGGMGGPGGWGGSSSSGNYSFSEGTYSISNTNITFTLTHQCSNMFICSEDLLLNNSYTITNGVTSYTWTQSTSSMTYK